MKGINTIKYACHYFISYLLRKVAVIVPDDSGVFMNKVLKCLLCIAQYPIVSMSTVNKDYIKFLFEGSKIKCLLITGEDYNIIHSPGIGSHHIHILIADPLFTHFLYRPV